MVKKQGFRVKSMHQPPRIGLAWQMIRRFGHDAIRGIADYANRYGPWRFYLNPIDDFDVANSPHFDGIIVGYDDVDRAKGVHWPADIPIVSVNQTFESVARWQVQPDNQLAGRLVAEDFIRRGFRHFGYCPNSPMGADGSLLTSDHDRFVGFSNAVRRVRGEVSVSPALPKRVEVLEEHWERHDGVAEWLRLLPKPVGIMAVTDQSARHVLVSADDAGVAVPEEAAIVGVGNEAWSEVALRGLSSVELDGMRGGYVAAEMLHQLMEGKKIKPGVVRIPPRRLVIRRSSSTTAIDDPDVLQAMHFIAERATSGIDVNAVVDAVPLSRRSLERRFERTMGRSILSEIRKVQVDRAKLLLADETIPLRRVATVAGFGSADALNSVFRRLVGKTPSAYRRSISDRQGK